MAYQTSGNVLVALSRETTEGTAATATGASQLRITDSPGLVLERGEIRSNERRADGYTTMGRLGNKRVTGSFNTELTAGGAIDILLEAIARSTYSAAAATTFASMTTVAVASNTLTAAAGSWITQGVAVGDVVTLTGTSQSSNHNLRTPVVGVSATVITVATATYTTVAASASGTLTRLKRVTAATTPTEKFHTIEQVDEDADASEYFVGCKLIGARFSFRPNQYATATWTFLGINRTAVTGASSPYFTSPTLTTNLPLAADDSTIRYNGSAVSTFTGFDIDFQINAAGADVIGSLTTPSIFANSTMISASVTGLRSDFANLTLFDAETEFEVSILLQELESAPKSCLAFHFPRVKIRGLSAPAGGGDGPKIETLNLELGPKDATTGYSTGPFTISSSE